MANPNQPLEEDHWNFGYIYPAHGVTINTANEDTSMLGIPLVDTPVDEKTKAPEEGTKE